MQRIRAGERTVCFDSSKYLVEEPEYLWDSGAIAFGWPLVLLFQVLLDSTSQTLEMTRST